jgi:hypothetical protein
LGVGSGATSFELAFWGQVLGHTKPLTKAERSGTFVLSSQDPRIIRARYDAQGSASSTPGTGRAAISPQNLRDPQLVVVQGEDSLALPRSYCADAAAQKGL